MIDVNNAWSCISTPAYFLWRTASLRGKLLVPLRVGTGSRDRVGALLPRIQVLQILNQEPKTGNRTLTEVFRVFPHFLYSVNLKRFTAQRLQYRHTGLLPALTLKNAAFYTQKACL
jgi:hypothetical protein